MSNVLNVYELKKTFDSLGWDMNLAEINDWLKESGIDPLGVYAYCAAVLATPSGIDDTTIAGVDAAQLPYIREFFNSKGVLYG